MQYEMARNKFSRRTLGTLKEIYFDASEVMRQI